MKISQDVSFLNKNISFRGLDVLEIGCGDGVSSQLFARNARSYIGIDVDKSAIKKAKSANSGNAKMSFDVGTGADLSRFQDGQFDIVLMFYTFHEIAVQEQGKTLRECARVLRPNGKVVIMDPSTDKDGLVQRCFDIIMAEIDWTDHPLMIRHSDFVLRKSVSSGRFKLLETKNFAIADTFKNFGKLLQFLDFDPSKLTAQQSKNIIRGLKILLKITDESKQILIDDKLKLTVLVKE